MPSPVDCAQVRYPTLQTAGCRLHSSTTGCWRRRSIRYNGVELPGLDPAPHHPSAHWKRLFLSTLRFTFSQVPHTIPTRQNSPLNTKPHPCDTASNHHPTFRSILSPAANQAFFSELQPRPTPNRPKHRTPLRQALYLDSPPSSASSSWYIHPPLTYQHEQSALQLAIHVAHQHQRLYYFLVPYLNNWTIFKSSFHYRLTLPTRDLRLHFHHLHHCAHTQPQQTKKAHLKYLDYNHFCNLIGVRPID